MSVRPFPLEPECEPYRLYLETLTEEELQAYMIARKYLTGIFNTVRNRHYLEWAEKNPEKHATVLKLHNVAPSVPRNWEGLNLRNN